MNTNLSRYRSQSLQVLFDDAQGDTSQDSRIYKLQKEEFRNCLVRSIERQARPIETRTYRILFKPKLNLMYQVSSKILLVYKGNPKHVFIRLFRERRMSLLQIQDFVPKKLSHVFYRCYSLKNLKIRYCRSCYLLQSSKVMMI